MRLRSLLLIIMLAFTLQFSVLANAQSGQVQQLVPPADMKGDSLTINNRSTGTRESEYKEAYYRIVIREERTNTNFWTKRVLSGFNNRRLRDKLIGYHNILPKPLNEPYTIFIEKAFRFPAIFFFLAVIVGLVINVLLVIGILFLTNRFMNYRKSKGKKLRAIYELVLTNLLLQVTDTSEAIRQLSRLGLRNDNNLLIEVMMDFQKSFRGDADRQIKELYQAMDLGRLSFNKTFAVSFYNQVQGIRELTNMQPSHAKETIISRLNDSNEIVRTEAQICYPHVNKDNPFDFLSFLEKPFSRWSQLNIYYFIKLHELPVPSFDSWANSGNPNVVHFCLRMIDLFQQHENSALLIQMLEHPNEATRQLAIIACGNLPIFESKTILKKIYPNENKANRLYIIKSFSLLGDDTDIPFLSEIAAGDKISLQLESCRILYNLSEAGKAHLEALNQSMNFELTPFIAHIRDPRN